MTLLVWAAWRLFQKRTGHTEARVFYLCDTDLVGGVRHRASANRFYVGSGSDRCFDAFRRRRKFSFRPDRGLSLLEEGA